MTDTEKSSITIYTKPDCVQCQATKRKLDAAGVPYTVTDLSKDPKMIEQLRAAGFTSVPVVEYADQRFAGYQPDRIKALTKAFGTITTIASNEKTDTKTTNPRPARQAPARYR